MGNQNSSVFEFLEQNTLESIRNVWDRIDTDSSGFLERDEAMLFFSSIYDYHNRQKSKKATRDSEGTLSNKDAVVDYWIDYFDVDRDGKLSWKEFYDGAHLVIREKLFNSAFEKVRLSESCEIVKQIEGDLIDPLSIEKDGCNDSYYHIFRYLDDEQLALCSFVCKYWMTLVFDKRAWDYRIPSLMRFLYWKPVFDIGDISGSEYDIVERLRDDGFAIFSTKNDPVFEQFSQNRKVFWDLGTLKRKKICTEEKSFEGGKVTYKFFSDQNYTNQAFSETFPNEAAGYGSVGKTIEELSEKILSIISDYYQIQNVEFGNLSNNGGVHEMIFTKETKEWFQQIIDRYGPSKLQNYSGGLFSAHFPDEHSSFVMNSYLKNQRKYPSLFINTLLDKNEFILYVGKSLEVATGGNIMSPPFRHIIQQHQRSRKFFSIDILTRTKSTISSRDLLMNSTAQIQINAYEAPHIIRNTDDIQLTTQLKSIDSKRSPPTSKPKTKKRKKR